MRATLALCLTLATASAFAQDTGAADSMQAPMLPAEFPVGDFGWPRQALAPDGRVFTIYQPQIDAWEDGQRLEARVAVAIESTGSEGRVIGALHIAAATETNLDERLVVIHDVEIIEANFPTASEAESTAYLETLRGLVPSATREISLDRVLAYVDRSAERPETLALSNDPPPIFVSLEPAVLIGNHPAAGTVLQILLFPVVFSHKRVLGCIGVQDGTGNRCALFIDHPAGKRTGRTQQ